MLNIWTAKRRSVTCYSIIPTDIESYSNSETNSTGEQII